MTFVDKIIDAGFIEQGQKRLLDAMPHKERQIPDWWKNYDTQSGWLGLTVYNPDAWFKKDGEDKEMQLSLQGVLMPLPTDEDDILLLQNRSCRYICLRAGKEKIYESYSGQVPTEETVNKFISS